MNNPTFTMCNNCPRISQACRTSYAQVVECTKQLRDELAAQGKYEVIVSYCGGKTAHLGAIDKAMLKGLVNAQATWTDKYGPEFEVVVLNRGLTVPHGNSHYVCRNKRVVQQYEHNVELL